jgi:hypothetical protein
MARGQGDTLVACWMMCDDVTGFFGGNTDWDLMFAGSDDGGVTWKEPYRMPSVVAGMTEAYPHLAMAIGSDRAVHCLFGTNGSFTTNYDIYWDYSNPGPGNAPVCYNYHAGVTYFDLHLGVEGAPAQIPAKKFGMSKFYPNPTNNSARISYTLPRPAKVNVAVYNITGQVVKTFKCNGSAGVNSLTWKLDDNNNNRVANGVFFVQLDADGNKGTGKLTVVR